MSTIPLIDPAAQRRMDDEHLRYLVIANYIYAAFHALGLLVAIGVVLFLSGAIALGGVFGGGSDERIAGAMMGVIGSLVIVLLLASTVLQFLLARFLDQRRGHTYCFVVSILNCLNMPFGTILGIFTLIVLMRPSVQHIFEEEKRRRDAAEIAAARGNPAEMPR
ncbi:MAG: hypothetical protein KIT83_13995 [Bryobacterales bacterium]|nr:hypothetical protein [Bryobacterales bacterium]